MTSLHVFRHGGKITKFEAAGHSGYAEEGSDIVCSAISILLQTAAAGLEEVAGVSVESSALEGSFTCRLSEPISGEDRVKADMILETMLLGLQAIQQNYGKYLKIITREV